MTTNPCEKIRTLLGEETLTECDEESANELLLHLEECTMCQDVLENTPEKNMIGFLSLMASLVSTEGPSKEDHERLEILFEENREEKGKLDIAVQGFLTTQPELAITNFGIPEGISSEDLYGATEAAQLILLRWMHHHSISQIELLETGIFYNGAGDESRAVQAAIAAWLELFSRTNPSVLSEFRLPGDAMEIATKLTKWVVNAVSLRPALFTRFTVVPQKREDGVKSVILIQQKRNTVEDHYALWNPANNKP